jgi:hypothetical protein
MALNLTPAEHAANPPATWTVRKVADRRWALCDKDGGIIETRTTKAAAEALKTTGPVVELYVAEGRWFAGDTPAGWKPYKATTAAN